MDSLRRLPRNLALVLALPTLLAWVVVREYFSLTEEQQATFHVALPLAVALAYLLACAALWQIAAPLRAALATGDREPRSLEAAALAGHRLPARVASVVLLFSVSATGAIVTLLWARGVPADIAAAGGAVGAAVAILGAVLTYSVCSSSMARALAALGPAEGFEERGTARGKILAVGYGLLTMAFLLLGATGYVRFRVEADADYFKTVGGVQQGALTMARGGVDPATAELVFLATGCPTALLGAGGQLIARFGPPGPSLTPGSPGVERVGGGWIMRRAVSGRATLASFLSEGSLDARRTAYWRSALLVGIAVYAAAAILVWFSARAIAIPLRALGEAAGRIASGDLSAAPPSVSRDEMGRLAAEFRRMAQGLTQLVRAVKEATRGVDDASRELAQIGDRVRGSVLDQQAGRESVDAATEAMQQSVALVGKGVDGLSEYVASTSSAVGEMAAALDEVRRRGSELERTMEMAAREVDGLSEAGRKAEGALRTLNLLAGQTGDTLSRVDASLSGLEMAAVASQLNAAQAAELAEQAGSVVAETAEGIGRLRAAVGDAQQRVTGLGQRAGDIDLIVDFIADVAGRTNLLSLNASIIAAQAGEHGKAFAVVADQIRELAAQIAASTKSIGGILRAVREDVDGTATLIGRGDELAAAGVRLAQNSMEALSQIEAATAQGHENASRIQSALQGHVESSREVSRLVTQVTEGSRAVSEAVERIGGSVAALSGVGRTGGGMVERVNRALEEQAAIGRQQLQSLERIDVMIEEVTRAVTSHGGATRQVHASLHELGSAAALHEAAVAELSAVAERLGRRARDLSERVGRFKTG
jgi:methyl-accepting chemotaxis protein